VRTSGPRLVPPRMPLHNNKARLLHLGRFVRSASRLKTACKR